jgi:hypothetical protein
MGEKFFGAFSMLALGPAGLLVNEMIDIDGIAKATIMEQAARAAGYTDEADAINKQIADHLENESTFATRNFIKSKIGQSVFNGTVTRIKDALNKSNQTWSQIGKTTTTTKAPIKSPEQLKKEQQDNEDRRQARKKDIERATRASVAQATTDDVSKAAQKKGGGAATISTGEMIKADEQTGFESRFYKKGGLIQRPKRKNKK